MKHVYKILAVVLILAIVMPYITIDSVTVNAETSTWGLYASYYQGKDFVSDTTEYFSVFTQAGAPYVYGNSVQPNGDETTIEWFDETINGLLSVSEQYGTIKENLTTFTEDYSIGKDGYMVHFAGTIMAEEPGTYSFVGLQVDNGCVIKIGGTTVYEYWGYGCWFDGEDHRLEGETSFSLQANTPTYIEIYYLELNGGESLEFQINDGEADKSFEEAGIIFDLSATTYLTWGFADLTEVLSQIIGAGGGNQSATFEGNDNYDESIDQIKEVLELVNEEPLLVDSFIINSSSEFRSNAKKAGCVGNNGILVEYTGYLTADRDGTYSFGLTNADNGCMVEINGQRVIEYWGDKGTFWNNGTPAEGIYMSNSSMELKAGESVPIRVVYLELNGEESFTMTVKAEDGEAVAFDASGFTLSPGMWENMNVNPVEYGGHYYQRFDKGMTWQEAKAYCEDLGGYLVTITSAAEQAFVESIVTQGSKYQYWIGLTTAEDPQWVTGESFFYSNWDSGDPDNQTREDGESEDYVHINNKTNPANSGSKRFKWNDMYYDNTFPGEENHFSTNKVGFICEWGDINTGGYNGNTYERFDESLTWNEAKAYCESLGGHLVTITSAEEQAFIETLLATGEKNQYWIGLTTAEDPQWITGEDFSYSNWDPGDPDNHTREDGESEDYVHINNIPNPANIGSKRFKWNDMYYDNIFPGEEEHFSTKNVGFICEWDEYSFINNQSSEYAYLTAEAWKNAGMENIHEYLLTFPSISKAVIDSYNSNQEFLSSVAAWKTMNLIFEPGEIVDDALSMKDYYSAILLSMIEAEIFNENFIRSIEESSEFECAKIYNQISSIIKSCDEIDHEKLLSKGTCTIEEITILNDRINALGESSKKIADVSKLLSTGKTINESINLCVNYANISNTSKYIVNVLKKIQKNSSDRFLSMAIDEIVYASENAFNSAVTGLLEGTVNVAKDYGVDKINEAWQGLLNSTIITKGALLGYKVGKPLSNFLFNTDPIISNYFEFTALYEIEKALKVTIKEYETEFYNKTDADSSLNYVNTVSLYFKAYYLSCDYSVELAKYSNLCPFEYVFYNGKKRFEELNQSFESARASLKNYENSLYRCWLYSLKDQYPEIYTEIASSLDNIYTSDFSNALVRLEYVTAICTGEELMPSVKVAMDNNVLSPSEYSVTYYNNIDPGTATVEITPTENSIYTGSQKVNFIIQEKPFIKRMSIRGLSLQTSLFSLYADQKADMQSNGITLPDIYFYEGEEVVASVEDGVIICDNLPIFVSENGIEVLMQDKDYIIEIVSDTEQIVSAELQELDENLLPINAVNYNYLPTSGEIYCEIKVDDKNELTLNGAVLEPDFSSSDVEGREQYNIFFDQCVAQSSAYTNQMVYISAIIPEGHIFAGWLISPKIPMGSSNEVSCFIMPEEDVYINVNLLINDAYFKLKNAISNAKNIKQEFFTKISYLNLQDVINEAQAVLANDISQALSEQMVNNIQMAIASLEEIDLLDFSSASLTLQDNLAINYKVNKSFFEEDGYTNPYVKFVLNDVETVVTEYSVVDDNYVFTFADIAPYMINDTIYATLYATYNGVEYASVTKEYSVATYCYNMLGKYITEEYAELQTLLVDLLNYGSKTQEYLNYKTDALANAQLTEEQAAWGTNIERTLETVQNTQYETIENPSVLWKGAGLTLQDSIAMRFKIVADNIENLCVKVVNANGEWIIPSSAFELIEEGSYYVYFDTLSAAQMSEPIYLTVYNGDVAVSHTIRYSIESYAYAKQNDQDTKLVELVKAMIKYGDSAYAYVS